MSDAEDPLPEDWRFYSPRSGFEYIAEITGRTFAAARWFDLRIRQLLGIGWSVKGVQRCIREEMVHRPWESN
jgi:hypothetical protein